ncbi:MAG TPA: 16S rRNA (cytidine(1402)-2'-O)-methyltransferase [Gemmatimonadaceae bacterium]|nr:16S rRNA (cytidine(1402)-2'-O)-methyltransferase [Gemmatimonadaceae bacterium]
MSRAGAPGAGAPAPDTPVGVLHVVSTPIGNLGDITARAIDVLSSVTVILAEDTRHSRVLADRFGIRTPMQSYHEHNEAAATPRLIERLAAGESMALITDAGTPLVSDPGARLVRAAIDAGVRVSPVPGASAVLAALVGAGLAADRFTFFGFLPRKGADRTRTLEEIAALAHTAVLYEAPGRTAETLRALAAAGAGARQAAVARELTKQFEEFRRGTVDALAAYYEESEPRGEVVVVIEGAGPVVVDEAALRERAAALRASGMSARDVTRVLMETAHAPRNLAYRLAHE